MKLVVVLESRFISTPDGTVWTKAPNSYPFWTRYLSVFDGVKVIARVKPVDDVDGFYKTVSGPNVSVCPVPHYVGLYEYAKAWVSVKNAMQRSVANEDALLLRVPSALASHVVPGHWRSARPYGLEVVGDPFDVFAPGTFNHPLRPVLRYLSARMLRRQCAGAATVSYVTSKKLQERYPCVSLQYGISDVNLGADSFAGGPKTFQTDLSRVKLQSNDYAKKPKRYRGDDDPRIIFIGTLEQKYKGLDVLLKALELVRNRGIAARLTVVGEGRYRAEMEQLTSELSLSSVVEFRGELPSGQPIRHELDKSTLLVLPSRTEGLPRVVLEAMAQSLPCVATNVGGIPELLEDEDMVLADDVAALAAKIEEVITSPERMNRMSARNLERAKAYHSDILQARREEFYRVLRIQTENWLQQQRTN